MSAHKERWITIAIAQQRQATLLAVDSIKVDNITPSTTSSTTPVMTTSASPSPA